MSTFQIDVWFCADYPIHKQDWRRYVVSAPDWIEAELIAVQMVSRFGHPVEAVVVDWPDRGGDPLMQEPALLRGEAGPVLCE